MLPVFSEDDDKNKESSKEKVKPRTHTSISVTAVPAVPGSSNITSLPTLSADSATDTLAVAAQSVNVCCDLSYQYRLEKNFLLTFSFNITFLTYLIPITLLIFSFFIQNYFLIPDFWHEFFVCFY